MVYVFIELFVDREIFLERFLRETNAFSVFINPFSPHISYDD